MKRPLSLLFLSRAGGRLASLALVALVLGACAVGAPHAQTPADPDAIDPPGRVGSITLLAGPATIVDLQSGSRETAVLNWPVTAGWRLETGRAGRAEVRIGSTSLRLDDETTVDFVRLDDHFVQIAVLRGSAALRLRNPEMLNEIEVVTQRERISFADLGRYRIDVDRTPGFTSVTAFSGSARIASGGSSFAVAAGQRGDISAPPMTRFQLAAAAVDGFDDWVAARDARDDSIRSTSYVSRETSGVEVLDDYGDWRGVADYGPVWFPRGVAPSWAPYRYGRWAWVDPWGWTWVDDAPWGFAPFHYGRWAVIGGVWGWVPGAIVPRPVYAPALVAWFGAPGITVSIGAPIGWFPLAPREVYVPVYRHSPRHLKVVNVQHVTNVERITVVQTPRYVHHHPDRSTWVPGDRFGRPEPVQRGQRPPPSEWRQYIARAQPPANVPNTKRRQTAETLPAARMPAAEPTPVARPPMMTPRTVDAPRAFDTPRAVESPRPVASPRGVESPRLRETPPAAEAPRVSDVPRARPAPEAPARGPRGRDERPAAGAEERRAAPRIPATAPTGPPPADRLRPREPAVPAAERPAPRGRGELAIVPRAPAAPAAAPVPIQVAPPAAASEDRQRVRARPEAPVHRDERSFERPTGRSPREAIR